MNNFLFISWKRKEINKFNMKRTWNMIQNDWLLFVRMQNSIFYYHFNANGSLSSSEISDKRSDCVAEQKIVRLINSVTNFERFLYLFINRSQNSKSNTSTEDFCKQNFKQFYHFFNFSLYFIVIFFIVLSEDIAFSVFHLYFIRKLILFCGVRVLERDL